MPTAHVNAMVRLKEDVPTLSLRCGAVGTVVSVWLGPGEFICEVEFPKSTKSPAVRSLFRVEQLEVVQ
jgi:hypothetical protein